jgi:predicted phage tail protein
MKIILHGILRKKYGESYVIITDTAADAIEGLSRQLPDWPLNLHIEVPGFATDELLRTTTDAKEIHLVPAMFGGGGKFAGIILGAAMVVAGIILIATPFGIPLIISGGTMMAMGVIQLFMKAPSVNKSNDPDASKYLGINKNTAEIGTFITLAWGHVKLYGHWVSLQSDADKLVHGVFPTSTS